MLSSLPVVPRAPQTGIEARVPDSCPEANLAVCLQRKLLSSCCLSEKGHHNSSPSPDTSHKGLRSKRTQPVDPEAGEGLSRSNSQKLGGRHVM